MKLATFEQRGRPRLGAVIDGDDKIVELDAAFLRRHGRAEPALASMLALIDAGSAGRAVADALVADPPEEDVLAVAAVQLLAPIPEPRQIRDFLCFEEHLRNAFEQAGRLTGRTFEIPPVWYEQPIYYKANRFSVVGPDTDVRWPAYAELLDYELELACIIGTGGVDIARDEALGHVFGYTIFNDVSARDAQMREMAGQLGPAKGKDFDTGNVLGPWIVTADEIGDPHDLTMVARVNGEEWSRGTSAAMHHRFEDVIAFVSKSETLYPGEVLGSGTVGTGCGLEQGRYLSPGDVVELEIDRIGVLRNQIVRKEPG
ncbi:MAG TPA: fumarylacetoacetate hydrolase family protein [Acidimicrobiia bacterium]|jgi:2-keto-4-pentenoate hydratase/2-oxohepta-3-ene-1,7-dioic acid hydratase in catechol pathway|nr:fumarylacetoacetate hydrolase family protein [Acidimicrobiia bacterium]